ncbi:MAG: hypothetical protein OEY14_14420, partial [Myxococcales bacterium]|nr:hypothetical protein [Myxococcales bacterium]
QGGLEEAQADSIVVALHAAGIGARKEREEGSGDEARFAIAVPSDDVSQALQVLSADHLPERPEPGLREVFGEGGIVPTATEERARYAAAISGELSRTLESMQGVLDARVHVAIPDGRDFRLDDARPRPRASVLLEVRDTALADPEAVKALVAGAVEQMQSEDVAVVIVQTEAATAAPSPLVHVGPIAVSRGSAGMLKGLLGGSLGLHLLLALLLLGVLMRSRRTPPASPPELEQGEGTR